MGRGQAGFSGRYNLENKCNRQTVVVKDLFQKAEGLCSGETQIQTKSANTSILCCVFKQKPLFSLLSTLHHGSFGGRAPRYRLGLLHRSYPRVDQGKYSLDRHPGDTPQHTQLLHSQLIFTHHTWTGCWEPDVLLEGKGRSGGRQVT